METNKIEKVDFTLLEQTVMSMAMKYGMENKELQTDLINLIEMIKNEQKKGYAIKNLAFELANKLS